MSSKESLFSYAVPNCRITDPAILIWISALIGMPQFSSLVLMLVVCGVFPEHWMIYLPHFFLDRHFLKRIHLYRLGTRLFDNLLVLPGCLNPFDVLCRHRYLNVFWERCCRRDLKSILPPAFDVASFRELLRLNNQISQTLSQTIKIPSALIVSRLPNLFTSLCQLKSFRTEIKILRKRFDWLHRSPASNPQMFYSIIKMMIDTWNPSNRWMRNDMDLFLILLLLMDPTFLPDSLFGEIERNMRSILCGGKSSFFPTYLNVSFIFFLQQSEFYEELKRKDPRHPDFAALERMTLADVLDGCGTFRDLSRFMNISPYHMGPTTFRWNIPNTFEILGNCFNPRTFCFHRELIDDTHIIMCIMMYHSFLAFYERFCLPLQLLFHQEPYFRMSMMSIDIAYVPYQRIREFLFMIFPAFLMKMDIDQKFIFASYGGEVIQRPHLLLAYFQVMYSNPNSGYLTEERKMEMIMENLHAFSSQDPRTLLHEYTRMFDWTAINQLQPCLFSMFLVNMFCKNVPKFLKELGLDLNAPPAYLSPVHSMKELLSRINIVSEMLGMPQLTDFSSFVEQTEYNRRLKNGPEQHLLREITDQIVPSSFKGPQLRANLQLEMRCELRPTLDEIISLLREVLNL